MSDKAKQIAIKWVTQNKEKLREISDKIWSYAELGFVEFKSSQLLADELEKQDFKVDRGVAGIPTAFVGTWGKGKPVIGVMGEYDALPGLSQPSKNSNRFLVTLATSPRGLAKQNRLA